MRYFSLAVMLAALCVSTMTDIKKREISLPATGLAFAICTTLLYAAGADWPEHLMGAGVMGMSIIAAMMTGKFGGGDALTLALAGYVLGISGALAFCICLVVAGAAGTLLLHQKGEVPLMPYILAAYIPAAIFTAVAGG